MEVVEIISYYIFEEKHQIEISFRLSTDNEDEMRTDLIDMKEFSSYGYDVINENLFKSFINPDEDEEEDFDDFIDIDEESLMDFLNEYYVVNPNKLPKSDFI